MIIKGKKLTMKYVLGNKSQNDLDPEYPYSLYLQVSYNRETTRVGVFSDNHSTVAVLGKAADDINDESNIELQGLFSRVFKNINSIIHFDIGLNPSRYRLKGLNQRLKRYAFRISDAVDWPMAVLRFYRDKIPNHAYDNLIGGLEAGYTAGEVIHGVSFYLNDCTTYLPEKLRRVVLSSILLKIVFGYKYFDPESYDCKSSILCTDWVSNDAIKEVFKKKIGNLDSFTSFPGELNLIKDLKFKESNINEYLTEIENCISFYILNGSSDELFDKYYLGL